MVESADGTGPGTDGDPSERPEPPTTLIAASGGAPEPPTRPMTVGSGAAPGSGPDAPAAAERAEPVWPGLTAAGLPTRVPRSGDEDEIREAFAESWESGPTSPTPLTRKPFTPTYLTEPPRQRRWGDDLDPTVLLGSAPAGSTTDPSAESDAGTPAGAQDAQPQDAAARNGDASAASAPEPKEPPKPPQPPEPKEPPQPAEPPEPRRPPEPKGPPHPPARPGPSPFPSPSPVPTPPEPVPPSPVPSPVPPGPPSPPVPAPPPPFPPPPGPVPPPPSIVPDDTTVVTAKGSTPTPRPSIGASTYQGGNYTELVTEPITGVVVGTGGRSPAEQIEMSGSLTGHLLSRNQELYRRRERRRKLKTVLWVSFGLLLFATSIAVVVNMLAGDFIRSMFDTFSDWAG